MVQELLDVKELSQLMKVSKSTLYAWVNQRKIPHIKLGKKVLFNPKDIAHWIDENTVK